MTKLADLGRINELYQKLAHHRRSYAQAVSSKAYSEKKIASTLLELAALGVDTSDPARSPTEA